MILEETPPVGTVEDKTTFFNELLKGAFQNIKLSTNAKKDLRKAGFFVLGAAILSIYIMTKKK